MGPSGVVSERRRPETTALYELVRDNLETSAALSTTAHSI